jgi:hypothetical protein
MALHTPESGLIGREYTALISRKENAVVADWTLEQIGADIDEEAAKHLGITAFDVLSTSHAGLKPSATCGLNSQDFRTMTYWSNRAFAWCFPERTQRRLKHAKQNRREWPASSANPGG